MHQAGGKVKEFAFLVIFMKLSHFKALNHGKYNES